LARLLERHAKEVLRDAGIPVPRGRCASSPDAAFDIAEEIGQAVAVKAQIHAGGRGKAGAIRFAASPTEAREAASDLLGAKIKGLVVREVLVEEKLEIANEFYVAIILDSARSFRRPLLMLSSEGGMDIECVPGESIKRLHISPLDGLEIYQAVDLLVEAEVPGDLLVPIASLCSLLARAYKEYDCFALEINPLVLTKGRELVCADCKMQIDNAAVFRHSELGIGVARDFGHEPTPLDIVGWGIEKADLRGSGFVMDMGYDGVSPGYIGFHPIGGGSAMMAIGCA
jgi:succinyl-CoA synthetase beta subunit